MPSLISTLRIPYGFIDDRLARLFEDIRGAIVSVDQEIGRLRVGVRFAPGAATVDEAAAFTVDNDDLELESAWWTSDIDNDSGSDPRQVLSLRRRNLEGGDATLIGILETQADGFTAFVRNEFPVNKESRKVTRGQCITLQVEEVSSEGTPDNVNGLLELLFRKVAR